MTDAARLYLVTPVLQTVEQFADALQAALEAAEIACVLLRTPPGDDRLRRTIASALTPLVQRHGAALLIEDDTRAVGAADADGVHVQGSGDALAQAIRALKPDRIVGVGGLATRDDAMLAGEAGADYLLFGEAFEGEIPPLSTRVERVAWWAEIFEVPCVAWARTLAEVEPLAAAGAEFIALEEAVWGDGRGPALAVRDAAATVAHVAERFAAEAL